MQTKLTLRLEEHLISKAKLHAKKTGRSVSQIVADFFSLLVHQTESIETPLPPTVQSLKGSLSGELLDKSDYYKHIEKKYL